MASDSQPIRLDPFAECDICSHKLPLDTFRVLNCGEGHCCCRSCVGKIAEKERGKPKCPFCRAEFSLDRIKDSRIGLRVIDPVSEATWTVVDGLNRMNRDAKLISVKKAADKLQRAANGLYPDQDLAAMLLIAIEDFKDRIVPLFTEVNQQREEIQLLKADRAERERQIKALEKSNAESRTLEGKVQRLQTAQQKAEKEKDRALSKAKEAVLDLRVICDKNGALSQRVSELEEENGFLRDKLELHKSAEQQHKRKMKKMQQHMRDLEGQVNAGRQDTVERLPPIDESAMVDLEDDSMSIRTTPRKDSRGQIDIYSLQTHSVDPEFDFEAMPGPNFSSIHKPRETAGVQRIKLSKDKVKKITNFPINLDKSGHPMHAVQAGPRRKIRVKLPNPFALS
ncbi:hypothetical protein AX17_005947 [Amanita inopinata Kibby_2008]|nr:hypothetical protein AX17_005947 [Amanita inopinata Kibby_2008]